MGATEWKFDRRNWYLVALGVLLFHPYVVVTSVALANTVWQWFSGVPLYRSTRVAISDLPFSEPWFDWVGIPIYVSHACLLALWAALRAGSAMRHFLVGLSALIALRSLDGLWQGEPTRAFGLGYIAFDSTQLAGAFAAFELVRWRTKCEIIRVDSAGVNCDAPREKHLSMRSLLALTALVAATCALARWSWSEPDDIEFPLSALVSMAWAFVIAFVLGIALLPVSLFCLTDTRRIRWIPAALLTMSALVAFHFGRWLFTGPATVAPVDVLRWCLTGLTGQVTAVGAVLWLARGAGYRLVFQRPSTGVAA